MLGTVMLCRNPVANRQEKALTTGDLVYVHDNYRQAHEYYRRGAHFEKGP